MKKEIIVLLAIFLIGFVAAVDVELDGDSVNVIDADDLYAYEITLGYDGEIIDIEFSDFLSQDESDTISGNLTGDDLFVYESRFDPERGGISGSGKLFDIIHSGSLELKSAFFVDNTGQEERKDYTGDGEGEEEPPEEPPLEEPPPELGNFDFSPNEFIEDLGFGEQVTREISIYNFGDEDAVLKIGTVGLDSSVSIQSEVFIPSGGNNAVPLTIKADRKKASAGKIFFLYLGSQIKEIPIVINPTSDDKLFDVSISLTNLLSSVVRGGTLKAEININQLGSSDEKEVALYYTIKDFSGNDDYLEDNARETFTVHSSKSVVRSFDVSSLEEGSYVLSVDVVYEGGYKTASAIFDVEPAVSFGPILTSLTSRQLRYVSLTFGVIAVLIVVLVISRFVRKRRMEGKTIER